jgi:hypothetical protein
VLTILFSATGQKIVEKNSSSNILNVDLSLLNDGIYFLLINNKTETWTNTLIKKKNNIFIIEKESLNAIITKEN